MRTFIAISAVLAWLFGLALLFSPAAFYRPTGIEMNPLIATLAQAHGATLVGLGTLNWLGRRAERRGLQAILGGNLVVQVLSLAVVLRTMTLGAGERVAPGIVIHVVLASLFAYFLTRARRLA